MAQVRWGPRGQQLALVLLPLTTMAVVFSFAGCARCLDKAGVEERTGLKLPKRARVLNAMVESGYDPATYVKVELRRRDVKTFLASLPPGSKVEEADNPYGGFDGAPPWWDVVESRKCILFTSPDAGYGDVEGLISLDKPQHPVLYVYSVRGLAPPTAEN